MKIPPIISSGLTKLKSISPHKAAATAVGVAGVYVALRDAHHWGKITARKDRQNAYANADLKYFTNTQYLRNSSKTTSQLKKKLFRLNLDNHIRGTWNTVTGYCKGVGSQILSHALTIGGAVAAFTLKGKKSLIGAGVVGLAALNGLVRHVCTDIKSDL